jgi:hypothetical protein
LKSQQEIDDFPKNYPECDSVGLLLIEGVNSITNFDSLNQLLFIQKFTMKNLNELVSTSGLRNVTHIGEALIRHSAFVDTFESLTRVNYLKIKLPEDVDSLDLSIFSSINYIGAIDVDGSGYWKGLPKFHSNSDFTISVNGNKHKQEISILLPEDQIDIANFSIRNSDSIIIDDLKSITEVNRVTILNTSSSDFRYLNQLKKIGGVGIHELIENHNNDFGQSFDNIDTLDYLVLRANQFEIELSLLFSNLKHIKQALVIWNNTGIIPFSFFDSFQVPLNEIEYVSFENRVFLQNNTAIEGCSSPYLCKALEVYADSVVIDSNSGECNLEEVLQNCLSDTEELPNLSSSVYPNPAKNTLNISFEGRQIDKLSIINMMGMKIKEVTINKTKEIDIAHLIPGVYVIQFLEKDRIVGKNIFTKI